MDKSLYINAVELISFDGIESIPTALFYKDRDTVYFGHDAIDKGIHFSDVNRNFKIDLGKVNPSADVLNRRKFKTACGDEKSAVELTKDFMSLCLQGAESWINRQGIGSAKRIIVAEPLAFFVQDITSDWLPNYRSHIRRILESKFEVIEFLPEPFAVFQYYRYGIRHQLASKTKKYIVFVLDFGGGTFDASVIETTKEGDLSKAGRHSKPFAASSEPIGGFFINRMIAEHLLIKVLNTQEDKGLLRSVFNNVDEWSDATIESLNERKRAAVKWLKELYYSVERPKISISKLITNWDLEADITTAVPIEVPINPLDINSKKTSIKFTALEFRQIFEHSVWNKRIKSTVKRAIKRAESELDGKPINLVLLSGGSANIGWLKKLIDRDFCNEFCKADTISFTEDFQKIVAKGLAVECARKTHEPRSEFASVTYNKLCLILNPDDRGYEINRYVPLTQDIESSENNDGILLESAQALKEFFNTPITWKVRMKHPPRQKLEYYFLRSTLNPEDLQNLYNIDKCVYTDKNTKFDSQILIEITVKEDGTCFPNFIYKKDREGQPEIFKEGRPFYIDMTYSKESNLPFVYLGFDFGTSNTSISYISELAIELIDEREKNTSWLELSDLADKLPFPISRSAKEYLAPKKPKERVDSALELLEAFFTFFSYLAYIELCCSKKGGSLFKGFMHEKRSIGPLKGLLFKCLDKLGNKISLCSPLKVLKEKYSEDIDKLVDELNDFKHDKIAAESINEIKIVSIIANVCNELMSGKHFGFYEDVKKKPFSKEFGGIFRVASGSQPFYKVLEYTGDRSYSEETPYIIDFKKGWSISLIPLIFWSENGSEKNCYIFDSKNKDTSFSYKVVGDRRSVTVDENNFSPLFEMLKEIETRDAEIEIHQNLSFSDLK